MVKVNLIHYSICNYPVFDLKKLAMEQEFTGCKLAYLYNGQLLVYRRDNIAAIPYPDMWDFPGGGREGDESPEDCVLRELREEFAIDMPAARLFFRKRVVNHLTNGCSWFFIALGNSAEIENIAFGDEGQYWRLISIDEFLSSADSMPILKTRLLGIFYT